MWRLCHGDQCYGRAMARFDPLDGVRNWRNSDLGYFERVRLTIKNNAIKAKNRSSCCGNYGEPGC